MNKVPAYILGASGFAAGELLRLLHGHPALFPAAVISSSSPDRPIAELHPHLRAAYADLKTASLDTILADGTVNDRAAIFSALPHGYSAGIVQQLLSQLNASRVSVVDMSADYRFQDKETFERIYDIEHGAPGTLGDFYCGIPEHAADVDTMRIAHPGCFTTSVVLATAPLAKAGYISRVMVSSVTGSTGSGREPKPTTHHPVRANNMYSYKPLTHRHTAEMELLTQKVSGRRFTVSFAPHSGPFARGIHTTIFSANETGVSTEDILDALSSFYSTNYFVHVVESPPRLKDVVGTNFCQISAQADHDTIAVFSVIDNLVKGASGGAIQWMNHMLGLPEQTGLESPGLGWL